MDRVGRRPPIAQRRHRVDRRLQRAGSGRRHGTIQLAHTDDTVRNLYIGGRTAGFIKEQVCKGTLGFLRKEARKPGSYFWLK